MLPEMQNYRKPHPSSAGTQTGVFHGLEVVEMKYLLSGAKVCTAKGIGLSDVLIDQGTIVDISPVIPSEPDFTVLQFHNCVIFPGFVDVHVHLREPGFSYKETIQSGTAAAARGGYTAICSMPNLNPPPDSLPNLQIQLDLIGKSASIHVKPYGTITRGANGRELADFAAMAKEVAAFSDDGRGVQCAHVMEAAMKEAKKWGKPIAAHCEDESLLGGGYIHDGGYAKQHGHRGIPSESEWKQLARDLDLVRKTGSAYHACHVSTKESVALLRNAKAEGLDVTAETAPHYLLLCDEDLEEDARFKMNPPIREKADQSALIEGLLDGTIDMIATDHAPHTADEKSKGLKDSAMGVVGLETAFPLLYTNFVKTGQITLPQLIGRMHQNPMERFHLGTPLAPGQPANLCVYDLEQNVIIDPAVFLSQGRSTPFSGAHVWGVCKFTMSNGKIVWEEQ